jgi:ubiquinone biosynthesis accessory factor UbiJ
MMLPIVEIACKVLNHLILQEAWAHRLLSLHEGKVVLLQLPVGDLMLQINGGYFSYYQVTNEGLATDQNDTKTLIQPSVTFKVSQEAVWGYLSGGKTAALKHVKIAGDVDFASDLNRLATDLHWEVEEDLSRLFGDAVATRITKQSKTMIAQGQAAIADLQTGIKGYLVNEKNILVDQSTFVELKSELRILRDDVERSEKRIERLIQNLQNKNKL